MTDRPVRIRWVAAVLAPVLTAGLTVAGGAWGAPPGDAAPASYGAGAPSARGGCLVPELRGFRLSVAKAELEWANCRLGRVRTRHAAPVRRGYVIEQQYYAGTQLRAQHRVWVVVGR